MNSPSIDSQAAYERAMARIKELSGRDADPQAQREREALVAACDAWDRGPGGEAAGERAVARPEG